MDELRRRRRSNGQASGKRAFAVVGRESCRKALEADCSIRGIPLYEQDWWRTKGVVRSLLNDPTSCLAKQLGSDGYSLVEHLLFVIFDTLQGANWQRSGRKSGKPKPTSPLNPKSRSYRGRAGAPQAEPTPRRPPTDDELARMVAELERSVPAAQRAPGVPVEG
jgi:hypothetical protein